MMIGVEKQNRSFASQRRSARLHVAWQHRFVASDNDQQNMSDQHDFQSTNLLCEGEKIFIPLNPKPKTKKYFESKNRSLRTQTKKSEIQNDALMRILKVRYTFKYAMLA
jgi:hypothetical protein